MRLIQRLIDEHINSVRSALRGFCLVGVCVSESIGKKIFFQANKDYIFFDELVRISMKQTGLGERLIKEKIRLGKIKLAFLTAGYYKQLPKRENEVDLFIVGSVSLPEVEKITHEEGEKIGREINYSIMAYDEFVFRKKNKDPFLLTILQQNRLVLIGKEELMIG